MILIEQSLCWTDLRIAGIIYSFINIILKVLVVVLGWQISYSLFMVAWCYSSLYILLHLMLIYGFCSRKPAILMWWLAFAPFQIITMQIILLFFDITLIFHPYGETWIGIGILALFGHLVLTLFMFHNLCVVYSVQHRLKYNQDGQNRDMSNYFGNNISTAMKPSITTDPPTYKAMKG